MWLVLKRMGGESSDGLWDGVLASKSWRICLYACAYISSLGANIECIAEEYVDVLQNAAT